MMLDPETVALAKKRIVIEFEKEAMRLSEKRAQCVEEMVGLGALRSGGTIKKLLDLSCESIRRRALLAWQVLHRHVTTTGVTYSEDLGAKLKEIVRSHLPEQLSGFKQTLYRDAQNAGGSLTSQIDASLSRTRGSSLREIESEIDLFVASLKRQQMASADGRDAPVFNVYAPIGAIQTGDGAVAHVAQTFGPDIRQQLGEVLDRIEGALAEVNELPSAPKNEVVEILQEARSESLKDRPNLTRLRATLTTIGQSLQTVGD